MRSASPAAVRPTVRVYGPCIKSMHSGTSRIIARGSGAYQPNVEHRTSERSASSTGRHFSAGVSNLRSYAAETAAARSRPALVRQPEVINESRRRNRAGVERGEEIERLLDRDGVGE